MDAFTAFIDELRAKPRIEYSGAAGAPGWKREYCRARPRCARYIRADGFFICMVSVGLKWRRDEAEALLATADSGTCALLYERSADSSTGRQVMIEITSEGILRDAEALMPCARAPKGARP